MRGCGGGFHAGYSWLSSTNLFLACVVGYTGGGLSDSLQMVGPGGQEPLKAKIAYSHNVNVDFNIGFGQKCCFYTIAGLSFLKEKKEIDVVLPGVSKATYQSRTPILYGPRFGLGGRFLISENLMLSVEATTAIYSARKPQENLKMWGKNLSTDGIVKKQGGSCFIQNKLSLGIAVSFPVRKS